jgi:hypothetical protein
MISFYTKRETDNMTFVIWNDMGIFCLTASTGVGSRNHRFMIILSTSMFPGRLLLRGLQGLPAQPPVEQGRTAYN